MQSDLFVPTLFALTHGYLDLNSDLTGNTLLYTYLTRQKQTHEAKSLIYHTARIT
jgi:hypothetical protein